MASMEEEDQLQLGGDAFSCDEPTPLSSTSSTLTEDPEKEDSSSSGGPFSTTRKLTMKCRMSILHVLHLFNPSIKNAPASLPSTASTTTEATKIEKEGQNSQAPLDPNDNSVISRPAFSALSPFFLSFILILTLILFPTQVQICRGRSSELDAHSGTRIENPRRIEPT
jgi:hypothetical protein